MAVQQNGKMCFMVFIKRAEFTETGTEDCIRILDMKRA